MPSLSNSGNNGNSQQGQQQQQQQGAPRRRTTEVKQWRQSTAILCAQLGKFEGWGKRVENPLGERVMGASAGRSVNLHLTLFAVPTNGVYPCHHHPLSLLGASVRVCAARTQQLDGHKILGRTETTAKRCTSTRGATTQPILEPS